MNRSRTRIFLFVISLTVFAACGSPVLQTDQVEAAFDQHLSNVQVNGTGTVEKILPDDTKGERHQRFVVQIASGRTVLIDHNFDIAPRIDDLRTGESIEFSGEYVWNERGGLVHWTHNDPAGNHPDGWIKYRHRRYD